ncbi:trehalose-phosphatase [Conexibacter sp. CPCC 206217]|uniref:trehalose-phosphatase n=1 Tax=Conexibacter sp. CPCC 206217 TaxID=3064574 RepID=UPI0027166943|nr:trehalose-phosphatase [Conexibacter sp. CPCC 206217]MDO8213700.1 trehalose-phosphatase [Conexibacter sp. CPCC 206217]
MTPARPTAEASDAQLAAALGPLRADPRGTAVLLDIDGTLAPIVRYADDAHIPEATRSLLIEIARRFGVVACVSGRRASDARRIVSIGTISYIGSHGTELLRAGSTETVQDPAVRDWSRRIQAFGREADNAELRRLRVRIEDKGSIVAFHWRGAPDEEAARAAIDTIAGRAEQSGLRTHWGRKVLEVRPPVRMDKGAGILSFLDGAELDAAIYVGDDVTDLDAFRALGELLAEGRLRHALRVCVASEEGPSELAEEADLVVDGTDGVRHLLDLLLADDSGT